MTMMWVIKNYNLLLSIAIGPVDTRRFSRSPPGTALMILAMCKQQPLEAIK